MNGQTAQSPQHVGKVFRRRKHWMCLVFLLLNVFANESRAVDPGFWIFPLRQHTFDLDVANRNEQVFEIDIKRRCIMGRCPVSFGIEFASKRGALKSDAVDPVKNAHVKEYFFVPRPGRLSAFRFPLHARMTLLNAKSATLFDETKPAGESESFYWGVPTITAIFGGNFHCLPSGKHKVIVKIDQADPGMQEFAARLVVLNEFKILCGE